MECVVAAIVLILRNAKQPTKTSVNGHGSRCKSFTKPAVVIRHPKCLPDLNAMSLAGRASNYSRSRYDKSDFIP